MINFEEGNKRVDQQIATEIMYSKESINKRIEAIINNDQDILDTIEKCVQNVELWSMMFDGYQSKRDRLDVLLNDNDIERVIRQALILVMRLCDRKDLLSSIAGQLAGSIKGMEPRAAVITAGEILALMDKCDLIYIENGDNEYYDENNGKFYKVVSKFITNPWTIDVGTQEHMRRAMYPLPMIVEPRKLKDNKHCGYLTKSKESLILRKGNHHDERISLDVLNGLNSTPLSINVDMLAYLTEDILLDEDDLEAMKADPERREQYDAFMESTAFAYSYLVANGNKFYLTHKFDKRGRIYCQGYHVSYQSNAFRKSVVDFANEEVVNGSFK